MAKFIETTETFLDNLVNLERAINAAHKIAEERFLTDVGGPNSDAWYRNLVLLESLTKIKCAIDANLPE